MHPIRRAGARDIENVARLHRLVRRTNLPFLPDLHTAEQDLRFFRDTVFVQCEVWVAGPIEGFIAFRDGWIDHLYIRPDCQRHGVGRALLDAGTAELREAGFEPLVLWVLSANEPGRRFYEACGWQADGTVRAIDFDDTPVDEMRYRRP